MRAFGPQCAASGNIEDCEVCCNPIQISYSIENGDLHSFFASGIDQ
ncbi:CPXCG motif-containing cysteine-rich protein [Negadavirga shengliensis]|uniref:CPXCG motif-containing cysteine-rich protein n=1 Tax=Negadavirga shengliensis TaxID=1389218 RepID=A0ABV9T301_9BACT